MCQDHAKHLENVGKNATLVEDALVEVAARRAEAAALLEADLSDDVVAKINAAIAD